MSTIPDRAIWFLESEVKQLFVGHSIKRVSNYIEHVTKKDKKLVKYKTFCGLKYYKEYDIIERKLEFSFKNIAYYKGRQFLIECAIDRYKKKVYWKVERIFGGGLF